ncbi:phenylacetate-CoA oxygenase/reductase subunit PaaK [Spirochaetota bacterium]
MSQNNLNIKIKPFGILDLLEFKNLVPKRRKKILDAPAATVKKEPAANALASNLHPQNQFLVVSDVREETKASKTYRLIADKNSATTELAVFRPGQYLSFSFNIGGSSVTRPYSLSSSPGEAIKGYYEITVKENEGSFVSKHIFDTWENGSKVLASGPLGFFYHEKLRDSKHIIGLAGGCGITPFRSMAKSIAEGSMNADLTLIYGSNAIEEIIFHNEFKELEAASKGRIKVIHVISGENSGAYENGFITQGLIKKHADPYNGSVFISGPQIMYEFLQKEIKAIGLRKKYVRWETFGEVKSIDKAAGYPLEKIGEVHDIIVHMGGTTKSIKASARESVLTAIERANMAPPSTCRSGICGFCRSLLVKGDVFIPEDEDGRRMADKQFGYIHPCSSFPLTDLEIIVPRAK